MKTRTFIFKDPEGFEIFVYKWSPDKSKNIKGVVQISHGMAEHSKRYERFAKALTEAGYIVYANDHRGHGRTAKTLENVGITGVKDSFLWLIKDMHQLTGIIKKENKQLKAFLLGHSMGSFLTQGYISLYGGEISGSILSGTSGKMGPIIYLGIILAKLEILIKGRNSKNPFLNSLSFGSYNKSFKPSRTDFDWLSRDNAEVDKYISDPFCGTVFTSGFFYDLFIYLNWLHKKNTMAGIPKNLPVYIFSGDKDPVGKETKTVRWLINEYKKTGISNLDYKFYRDGRHESLNEINRDEVTADIISWIDRHL